MKIHEVKTRVQEIEALYNRPGARDNEALHSKEDDLYLDVLRHIAAGGNFGRVMAMEAIRVADLPFERWYS